MGRKTYVIGTDDVGNPRNFTMKSGDNVIIKDKNSLQIIEGIESLELNPSGAYKLLLDALCGTVPTDSKYPVTEFFLRVSLSEQIMQSFDRGKLSPIGVRYAERHGLSGRLMA